MSKVVIKAGHARFVDNEEPKKSSAGVSDDMAGDEGEPLFEDREERLERADPESDFQDAYDELISVAQDEVTLMMEDARVSAQKVVQDARQEAQEIQQTAFEEGYSEGKEAAREQTMELLQRAQREADELLQKARAERDAMLGEMEPKIMGLAVDVAEKILQYELERNDEAFMSILTSALNSIKAEGPVTLKVSMEEYERFFDSRDTAKVITERGSLTAKVAVDPAMRRGGLIIETQGSVVDAGMEAQLEQIGKSLGA